MPGQAQNVHAGGSHESLNQVVREYLEQLAGQDQLERDAEEFRRLSGQGKPDPDWKFNRDEIHDRKVRQLHQLSIWDALILEAATVSGSRELLSEDLQSGFRYGGVTVVNPFQ